MIPGRARSRAQGFARVFCSGGFLHTAVYAALPGHELQDVERQEPLAALSAGQKGAVETDHVRKHLAKQRIQRLPNFPTQSRYFGETGRRRGRICIR